VQRLGEEGLTRGCRAGLEPAHEKAGARPAFSSFWWAVQGSNLRPLPCEGNALPLS
jgi:hypothetical protein